jgi:hypothetical protein
VSEERFRALLVSLQERVPFDDAFNAAFGASALELAQRFFTGSAASSSRAAHPPLRLDLKVYFRRRAPATGKDIPK